MNKKKNIKQTNKTLHQNQPKTKTSMASRRTTTTPDVKDSKNYSCKKQQTATTTITKSKASTTSEEHDANLLTLQYLIGEEGGPE